MKKVICLSLAGILAMTCQDSDAMRRIMKSSLQHGGATPAILNDKKVVEITDVQSVINGALKIVGEIFRSIPVIRDSGTDYGNLVADPMLFVHLLTRIDATNRDHITLVDDHVFHNGQMSPAVLAAHNAAAAAAIAGGQPAPAAPVAAVAAPNAFTLSQASWDIIGTQNYGSGQLDQLNSVDTALNDISTYKFTNNVFRLHAMFLLFTIMQGYVMIDTTANAAAVTDDAQLCGNVANLANAANMLGIAANPVTDAQKKRAAVLFMNIARTLQR